MSQTLRSFVRLGLRPRSLIFPAVMSIVAGLAEAGQMMLLSPISNMVVDEETRVTKVDLFSNSIPIPLAISSMGQRYVFALLVGGIFAFITLKVLADLICSFTTTKVTQNFLARLRTNLFERYIGFSKTFYDRLGVARVYSHLMSQSYELAAQLPQIRNLMTQAALTGCYAYVLATISWKLALLSVALYPVYKLLNSFINKRIAIASAINYQNTNRFAEFVNTTLNCIPLIKAANGEADAHRRFVNVANDVARTEIDIEHRGQFLSVSHEFIVPLLAVGMLVALRFSTVLHADGGGARVLVFFLALRRCASSSSGVFLALSRLSRINILCDEIEKTMQPNPDFLVADGPRELPAIQRGISLKGVSFGYGDNQVLKNVNIEVPRGAHIALVGPTGSGKSTILSLLLRLYEVEPGTVMVDGVDIREYSLRSVRERVAIVSQDCYVLNDTLRNNLALFARGPVDDERLWSVIRMACFEDRVKTMPDGLETAIGDRGIALSGGEKQRLAIARALLRDPEILLLDEATSALDRETESRLNRALAEFCRGRTVVAVAHRLAAISDYDQIVTLRGGVIVEQGSYNELMARPDGFFRQSVEMQNSGLRVKAG